MSNNKVRWVKLQEICQTTSGGTPSRNVAAYYNGNIPWVKSGELLDGPITQTEEKITEEGVRNSSAKVFPSGTLLIALYGATVGRLGILNITAATNQAVCAIFPNEKIHREYLFYYLLRQRHELIDSRTGGAQPNISQEIIRELELPLPPLSEQHRIADLLAKADRLCRLRRYANQLGETYLQSVFLEMFDSYLKPDFPSTPLEKLVKITGGGTPSRDIPEYFEGSIPWLTSKDMRGDYIYDTQEHITEKAIRESATNLVPVGSILLVVKSKILMRRLPIAITKVPICHGQDIKSIQCSEKVNPFFLVQILKQNEKQLLFQARGANTEGLTLPMLNEIKVPNISRPEQECFVTIVRRYERLRAQGREAGRQAELLFQSLLNEAFSHS